jgi:RNA polymerase sigma-70 factor (ECF subfamily)
VKIPSMQDPSLERQIALAERTLAGDREAESELVRVFSPRVFAMLCARTRDREASRDLLQDVFIALLSALRQGQLREADKLGAFVLGIARNIANSHLRARIRDAQAPLLPDQPDTRVSAGAIEASERADLVRRALVELDSTDREILQRTLSQGQKPGAIAEALGLSSEAVRQRKSRAIKKVADYVKNLSRKPEVPPHA